MCGKSQLSWIELRSALAYPRGDSEKVFVMVKCASFLESYMDDAGSHNGAPVSVIAGYFGGHQRWKPFQDEWEKVLLKYGTEEFHAFKFWKRDDKRQRVGEYKGWSDRKADDYIDELLTIIENSTRIFPFAVGVQNSEWDKQPIANRRIFSGASRKYPSGKPSKSMFLAFQRCVIRVADYCKSGIKASYFYDDDHGKNSAWASICYSNLKDYFKKRDPDIHSSMGDITMADGDIAVPLQAADLLAYQTKKFAERFLRTGREIVRIEHVRALANLRSKEDFWLFDRKRFSQIESAFAEIDRKLAAKRGKR